MIETLFIAETVSSKREYEKALTSPWKALAVLTWGSFLDKIKTENW